MKFFIYGIFNLFPNSIIYFCKNSSSFIKKDIHLVPSKSLLYALIFGRNIDKDLSFLEFFWQMKYLNSFLSKETLLDTTDYLFFKWNRPFMLVKLLFLDFNSTKFYNNFFHFLCTFKMLILFFNWYFSPFLI